MVVIFILFNYVMMCVGVMVIGWLFMILFIYGDEFLI